MKSCIQKYKIPSKLFSNCPLREPKLPGIFLKPIFSRKRKKFKRIVLEVEALFHFSDNIIRFEMQPMSLITYHFFIFFTLKRSFRQIFFKIYVILTKNVIRFFDIKNKYIYKFHTFTIQNDILKMCQKVVSLNEKMTRNRTPLPFLTSRKMAISEKKKIFIFLV